MPQVEQGIPWIETIHQQQGGEKEHSLGKVTLGRKGK